MKDYIKLTNATPGIPRYESANTLKTKTPIPMWVGLTYQGKVIYTEPSLKSTNCKNCAAPTSHNRDDCAYCGTIY